MKQKFISIEKWAQKWGVSKRHAYRLVKEGRLQVKRMPVTVMRRMVIDEDYVPKDKKSAG
jgi:predicted site-specific integrase-resolvase